MRKRPSRFTSPKQSGPTTETSGAYGATDMDATAKLRTEVSGDRLVDDADPAVGGVALLYWPEEDGRRSVLAVAARLRLLLVEAGAPAPVAVDPREDWVRLPASEQDIEARVLGLLRRSQRGNSDLQLDARGLLHRGEAWVPLPETEASLMAALLEANGSVVSRTALVEAAWPGGSPTRNVLDVHMVRLRRRVAVLGVEIRTVRSRGYALAR